MTPHCQNIITTYKSGLSLRETGDRFGISYKRVWYVVHEYEPEALRPAHVTLRGRCLWPQAEKLKQNWFHWYMRKANDNNSTIASEST